MQRMGRKALALAVVTAVAAVVVAAPRVGELARRLGIVPEPQQTAVDETDSEVRRAHESEAREALRERLRQQRLGRRDRAEAEGSAAAPEAPVEDPPPRQADSARRPIGPLGREVLAEAALEAARDPDEVTGEAVRVTAGRPPKMDLAMFVAQGPGAVRKTVELLQAH